MKKKYWAAAVCLFTNCHFFDEVTLRLHPKPVDPQAYYFFFLNFVFKTQSFVSFLCNHWEKACLFLSTKESERPCSPMSNSYVVHLSPFC